MELEFIERNSTFVLTQELLECMSQCAIMNKADGLERGYFLLGFKIKKEAHPAASHPFCVNTKCDIKNFSGYVSPFINFETSKEPNQFKRSVDIKNWSIFPKAAEANGLDSQPGSIRYIGEWHTHSRMPDPSTQDLRFVKEYPQSVLIIASAYGYRTVQNCDKSSFAYYISKLYDYSAPICLKVTA